MHWLLSAFLLHLKGSFTRPISKCNLPLRFCNLYSPGKASKSDVALKCALKCHVKLKAAKKRTTKRKIGLANDP